MVEVVCLSSKILAVWGKPRGAKTSVMGPFILDMQCILVEHKPGVLEH